MLFKVGITGSTSQEMTKEGYVNFLYEFLYHKEGVKYKVLWFKTSNMLNNGRIEDIPSVTGVSSDGVPGTWEESQNCSGNIISKKGHCELRYSEMMLYQFDYSLNSNGDEAYGYIRLDIKEIKQEQAKNSFVLILVTILLLFLSSIYMGNDTNNIMTKPITKMVNMVKRLTDDPLRTASAISSQQLSENQNSMLDNVVIKIGKLIELGYGSMGTELLAENIINGNGTLDLMVNGSKINSVVLAVRIADYNKIASHLQEEITVFTNKISSLIVECAETWEGYVATFTASCFIITWKLPVYEDVEMSKKQEALEDSSIRVCQAVITAIKIIAEFRRSREIKMFLKSSKLKSVMREFKIYIALNFGWAIEGAIGFSDRAEALLLSPLLEETINLTNLGKKLRLPIVMSANFYHLLTNKGKQYIRELGLFKFSGVTAPKGIYSLDINDGVVEIISEEEKEVKIGELRPKEKYENTVIDMKDATSFTLDIIYIIDLDMAGLITLDEGRNKIFREALAAFITRDWVKANTLFSQYNPKDLLAKMYIDYINQTKFQSDDWDGSIDCNKLLLEDR